MMKLEDIKFRGKVSYDEDRWVYGSLARDLNGTYIILPKDWAKGAIVIPKTISQYTGYKVGEAEVEVYEGDTLWFKDVWPNSKDTKDAGVVIGVGEHAQVKFANPHMPLYSLKSMIGSVTAVIPPSIEDFEKEGGEA